MRFWAVFLVSSLLFGASDAGKQPINAADLLKIRRITAVDVAHDGSLAVYGVQSIHTAKPDEYSYRTHLWSVDLTTPQAKPVQLTHGDRNDGAFTISPDGRQLAFIRSDGAGERRRGQVWLMPLRGPGEATPLTTLEHGAAAVSWRPDGKALLVTSAVPISKLPGKPHFTLERPNRDWSDFDPVRKDPKPDDPKVDARPDGDRKAIRNWLEKNAASDNPTVITRIAFLDEQGLRREMTIPELFLIDLDHPNTATQLTKDFYPHNAASFSPDGKQIVYISTPPGPEHPDRVRRSVLWIVNADGSNPQPFLDRKEWSFSSPHFTDDGKGILLTAQETDQPTFRQSKVARADLASKEVTLLARNWTSSAQAPHQASDGSVLFLSPWHGGEPLLRAQSGAAKPLTDGPTGVSAYSEGAGRIVYALIRPEDPNELFLRDTNGATRQLTELNTPWLEKKKLSLPREKWITAPDGTRVQSWVMNPIGVEAGKKSPVVLDMHGGPSAMWGPGEFSMWHEFQTLCAMGYAVVYANQRGSSGYGYDFQHANYRDWGAGPTSDVLAALDDALKNNPSFDRDRLFLTGGSYAGYLTAWIIGHDHRFKAAVAQRGVYELTTFFGEGNAFRLVENSFGGFPWEPEARRVLDRESPLTYAKDIRTPFLIIHGSQDLRTGVTQSEMLFRTLKQMGKPVEYVRYPNIGHELTRSGPPLQRMDHLLRIVEFFDRFNPQ